jgi:ankyrin repeat protein
VRRALYESIFRRAGDRAAALAGVQRVRDPNEPDQGGGSLLGTAAYYGHAEACAWILDHGGVIDIRGRSGRTPLLDGLWALSDGTNIDWIVQAVRLLLDRGASVTVADEDGATALHYAVDCADTVPDIAGELLDRGADTRAVTGWGQTPLMRACERQHLGGVQALLDRGVDVNVSDELGRTALFYALDGGWLDERARRRPAVVACLLDAGAALAGEDRNRGETLLMAAVGAGIVDLVARCLTAGASPNPADHNGMTALHKATARAYDPVAAAAIRPIVSLLLEHGADPAIRDKHKRLPADLNRNDEIRSLLGA